MVHECLSFLLETVLASFQIGNQVLLKRLNRLACSICIPILQLFFVQGLQQLFCSRYRLVELGIGGCDARIAVTQFGDLSLQCGDTIALCLFASLHFTSFLGSDDDEPDDHATNVVITVAATLMVAITVLAVAAAPLIFRLYSLNLADDVDADLFRSVGTTLTRIFLIQILFYGASALWGALLNTRKRFFAPAWAPILSNVAIIASKSPHPLRTRLLATLLNFSDIAGSTTAGVYRVQ